MNFPTETNRSTAKKSRYVSIWYELLLYFVATAAAAAAIILYRFRDMSTSWSAQYVRIHIVHTNCSSSCYIHMQVLLKLGRFSIVVVCTFSISLCHAWEFYSSSTNVMIKNWGWMLDFVHFLCVVKDARSRPGNIPALQQALIVKVYITGSKGVKNLLFNVSVASLPYDKLKNTPCMICESLLAIRCFTYCKMAGNISTNQLPTTTSDSPSNKGPFLDQPHPTNV